MNGILNLYKPGGITSSTAVGKVRRILGQKCVGHMGTLDPAGEGVLLIGVGKAARLFDYFLTKDKQYQADFTFGYETDTLDGDGQILQHCDYIPTLDELTENLAKLVGKQMQMPPDYSAKSIGGVRAYTLARQGKPVDLKPAAIQVFGAEIIGFCGNVCTVRVHCSSGTYIRSICRDLAKLCGSLATMTAIKRLACGDFLVENAVDFDTLERLGEGALIKTEDALSALRRVELKAEFQTRLNNGVRISVFEAGLQHAGIPDTGEDFTLFCEGKLYGIAHIIGDKIVIKTYLKD